MKAGSTLFFVPHLPMQNTHILSTTLCVIAASEANGVLIDLDLMSRVSSIIAYIDGLFFLLLPVMR